MERHRLRFVARRNVKKDARNVVNNPEFVAIKDWETFKRELSKAFPMNAEAIRNWLQFYKPEKKTSETFRVLRSKIAMDLERYAGGGNMLAEEKKNKIKEYLR